MMKVADPGISERKEGGGGGGSRMVLFNTPSVKVYACPAVEIYNNNNFKFSQGDVRPVRRFPIQLRVGGVSSTQTFQTLLHY